MKTNLTIWIYLILCFTISAKRRRPLGGSISHKRLTPKSIAYHKIIPNSKHDRIKTNRHLKIVLGDDHEEEMPFDGEEDEWKSGETEKSIGELEMEVDEAIHENDHLEDEKHEDDPDSEGSQEEEAQEEEEEEEANDGSKLEDLIVGVQISRMEDNLAIFRDLIINCIDRHYAKDMFMDQEIVTMICLGERYEILERTYHDYLTKIHRIFDKIWRHKVSEFRETYKDDIILFFNIVRLVTLKDLHLRKSLEITEPSIKFTMDPKTFTAIKEAVSEEIDAYDEIRGKLIESKNKVQEHLDEREREKQEALDKLKEAEEHEEEEQMHFEGAHPDEEEEIEDHENEEFDDGYEEEKTNLEDESEETVPPEESEEDIEDLSYDPNDERGQYDSEDASVGPEGESSPSLDSEQRAQALKNPDEPTPDPEVSEEKVDPPEDLD